MNEQATAYYILSEYAIYRNSATNTSFVSQRYAYYSGRAKMCEEILKECFYLKVGYDEKRNVYFAENLQYRVEVKNY